MKKMGGTAKTDAMRSVVVVVGTLAFGYLSMQLGFKPYLERAQLEQQRREAFLQSQSAKAQSEEDHFGDSFHAADTDRLPESDKKL